MARCLSVYGSRSQAKDHGLRTVRRSVSILTNRLCAPKKRGGKRSRPGGADDKKQ